MIAWILIFLRLLRYGCICICICMVPLDWRCFRILTRQHFTARLALAGQKFTPWLWRLMDVWFCRLVIFFLNSIFLDHHLFLFCPIFCFSILPSRCRLLLFLPKLLLLLLWCIHHHLASIQKHFPSNPGIHPGIHTPRQSIVMHANVMLFLHIHHFTAETPINPLLTARLTFWISIVIAIIVVIFETGEEYEQLLASVVFGVFGTSNRTAPFRSFFVIGAAFVFQSFAAFALTSCSW
mmetsp:Transcript_20734/g.31693  ORF Transcript_20734/g.31693 Transcript_20734/m.31693 type:complete len:237 (+) Transcript_20734:2539-3249(+)